MILLDFFPFTRIKELDFYTTGNSGDYTVVVRGLDQQGDEFTGEIEFRVK